MAMKIAVVEKSKTGYADPYREYFDFDYDRFQLTNSNKTKIPIIINTIPTRIIGMRIFFQIYQADLIIQTGHRHHQ